jgi:hypothetical protein
MERKKKDVEEKSPTAQNTLNGNGLRSLVLHPTFCCFFVQISPLTYKTILDYVPTVKKQYLINNNYQSFGNISRPLHNSSFRHSGESRNPEST